jgi:hypothetical protein
MAEMAVGRDSEVKAHTPFFVWMAALCVFFAFGGFTPTYFAPMATGALRSLHPAVHIHGVLFFGWTLLLLLQSALVARGQSSLHRSVGLIGIAVACAMVIFGAIVNLLANSARIEAGLLEMGYRSGLVGMSQVVAFGAMFSVAIHNIARKEYHRRWMLFATTMILPAAVFRLYLPLFDFEPGPSWLVLATVNLVPLGIVIFDIRTRGRLHSATMVGFPLILALQIGARTLDQTQIWRTMYDSLLYLVG